MSLNQLYPEIEPYKKQYVKVDNSHSLYLEESGNPQGIPVVNLHGGPGSGCNTTHRKRFDPTKYRIICFDQRGAGRSKPSGSIKNNTTQNLIQDIEVIRKTLNIDTWMVYGYSWGSTLALAYAEKHPKNVSAMLIGGILLGTKKEMDWITKPDGIAAGLFPEAYSDLMNALDNPKPSEVFRKGFKVLKLGKNNKNSKDIAKKWMKLDMLLGEIELSSEQIDALLESPNMFAKAFIQKYYASNGFFLKPNQLIKNVAVLSDIPIYIVQGRLDFLTPPKTIMEFTKALPHSKVIFVHNTGHGGSIAMESHRVEITNMLARKLAP